MRYWDERIRAAIWTEEGRCGGSINAWEIQEQLKPGYDAYVIDQGLSSSQRGYQYRNRPRIIYMTSCVKHLPQHEVVSKYRYERGYKL